MRRRNFLKSTLTLGGAAAATTGLAACSTVDDRFDAVCAANDPLLLDLLSGNVYALDDFQGSGGKSRFGSLPLADFPLLVAERSELDL